MLLATCLALVQAERGPDPAALDVLMRRHAAAGFTGAALVSRGGETLLLAGHGFADIDADRPNDADSLFDAGPLTQALTAVGVLRLDQEGALDVDETIGVRLPAVPPHSRAITLRQLLAHTSGIPSRNGSGRAGDLSSAVVAYLGSGPETRPGSRFVRWDGGYALLSGAIERASGSDYVEFMETAVLGPAGMTASGFPGAADLAADHAALGESTRGPGRSPLADPSGSYGYASRGAVGLVTSVRDLHAFDRALAAGTLLDEAHLADLFTPERDGWALGWKIDRALDGSPRQSQGGSVRGFASEMRRYPAHDACVAVLANRDDVDAGTVAEDLENALFGRSLAYPALPAAYVDAEEAAACSGPFVGSAGRLVVCAAGGVLVAGIEGRELIDAVGANEPLDWTADPEALGVRAALIVEGIARGDTEPLRTAMSRSRPQDWPVRMRSTIWPALIAQRGEFRGARPLGVVTRDQRVLVLLALEHAGGSARALLEFGPAGLERLDWNGPRFLVTARLDKLRTATFRLDLAPRRPKLEFHVESGRATGVRLDGLELVRP